MTGQRAFLVAALLVACREPGPGPSPARAPAAAMVDARPRPAAVDGPAAPPVITPVQAEPPERDPDAPKVRLSLTVLPVDAEVVWGRRKLGLAGRKPLEVERPRNSGPLDVVIRASGFLPYHTRLFTDRDDALTVRLLRPDQARSLPGWKPPPRP